MSKYNIESTALAKLLFTHIASSPPKYTKELVRLVIESAANNTGKLIDYLEEPERFVHPDYEISIGDTVLVDITNLWSNNLKHYKEKELIVDDKWFSAKIIGFNFIKGDMAEIEFKDYENNMETKEVYCSYVNASKLL